jgi:hypothetical protein
MKPLKLSLAPLLIMGLTTLSINAQEKKEQLWYCGEETVKPGFIDEYLKLSREFIEICKQEKFPFSFYTWTSKPFVYELWYPVNTLDDVKEIDKAWQKVTEKFGAEKYAAFNNTKVRNRSYSMSIRNDLQYTPKNPDYDRNEVMFCRWIEYSLIPGKNSEFEEAVKWMNSQRESAGPGHFVIYGTGGLGYDDPVYMELINTTSQEDFLKRTGALSEKMAAPLKEYHGKIYPLTREMKSYDWWLLWDLSYQPAGN